MLAALAFALFVQLPPPAERPRDIWVFRSVLDSRPRMVTVALHEDLWVSYDATHCSLYKAWNGGVKFDGAVYTTVHGPQPTSYGDAYEMGILDEEVWRLNGESVKAQFKGYRFDGGHVRFQYWLPNQPAPVKVFETPEYSSAPDGRVAFVREFRVEGAGNRRVSVVVAAPVYPGETLDSTISTNGKYRILGEKDFEVPGGQLREMTLELELSASRPTYLTTYFKRVAPLLTSGNEEIQEPGPPREPGLAMRVYYVGENLSALPILLPGQTPNVSVVVPKVDLRGPQAFGGLTDQFYVEFTGFLTAPQDGEYGFRLTSDDGSRLTIDDKLIVDNDGLHSETPAEGRVFLAKGDHTIKIEYFENGGDEVVRLEWRTPGSTDWEVVPTSALSTQAGEVRVTSPGKKNVMDPAHRMRPGSGLPLTDVHPAFDRYVLHGEEFKPRVGGIAFLPDGRMVVCTWDADGAVYLLDGVLGSSPSPKVRRIAVGLAEPLGITVVRGEIYVLQKQELTKLIDHDGDGITDEYFAVANGWGVTANFHEFAFGLLYHDGHFYGNLAIAIDPGGRSTKPQNPDRGKVIRIAEDGSYEFVASGLRTPNGIGFGYNGLIFLSDNQGDWLPSSKILLLEEGAFYGNRSVDPVGDANKQETPPVVWLPQGEIGNSPSQIAPLNYGPYRNQQIHGDVTHGGLKRVFVEEVNGRLQGCVFRFTQGLNAGINRVVIGPDRAIYVGGIGSTGNWGQAGKERFGLEKLVYNGNVPFEPLAVRAYRNGFEIEFTAPVLDGMGESPADYRVVQWRYVPTEQYGGPKVDVENLAVKSVTFTEGRRKVFLEIDGLKEGHVVYLDVNRGLADEAGRELWTTEAWYTLNQIPARAHLTQPKREFINELTPEEQAQGFRLLFDGKTLQGWRGFKSEEPPTAWKVEDGALVLKPDEGSRGDLMTKEKFGDFELRLQWKISPGGNSGIFFRVDNTQLVPWNTGPEMQVLDDDRHLDGREPKTSAGSNYGLHARSRDTLRPVGSWNDVRIVAKGNHVEYWLNGFKVVEYEIGSEEWNRLVAESKFKDMPMFGKVPVGFILLQDHGDVVWYRSIRIRELK